MLCSRGCFRNSWVVLPAQVLAQPGALVFVPNPASFLQFRDDEVNEVFDITGCYSIGEIACGSLPYILQPSRIARHVPVDQTSHG